MSKKKPQHPLIRNRLDSLFSDIEQEAVLLPPSSDSAAAGWRWTCDLDGNYVSCDPQVESILGIRSQDFIGQPLKTFALDVVSTARVEAILQGQTFPTEVQLNFRKANGQIVPATLRVFAISTARDEPELSSDSETSNGGWWGFAQILLPLETPLAIPVVTRPEPDESPLPPTPSAAVRAPQTKPIVAPSPISPTPQPPSTKPLTRIGQESLQSFSPIYRPASSNMPATMAVPFRLHEQTLGLLEMVDDAPTRYWSEDERRMVEQVADQLSLALENARLFQETQTRANELNTLVELSRLVSQNLDLEAVYKIAYRIVGQIMPTDTFFINLLDQETHEFITAYEIDHNVRLPEERFSDDQGFSGHVLRTGQPYIAYDLDTEPPPFPRLVSALQTQKVCSLLAVPLRFSDRIIGAISTQSYHPNAYTENDLRLLQALSDPIAIALQNANLLKETQTRADELAALNDLGRALGSNLSLDQVLDEIYRGVSRSIDTTNFYIALFDPLKNELVFPLNVTESQIDRAIVRIPAGAGLTGHIIRTRESILVRDGIETWLTAHNMEPVGEPAKSWLGVPLLAGDQIIGAMAVQSYTEYKVYDEHDRYVFQAIANQASISIQNARLFQETKLRADELSILNEMGRALSSNLEPGAVIETLFTYTSRIMTVENFFIALYNDQTEEITFPLVYNEGVRLPPSTRKLGAGLTDYVIHTRQPLLLNGDVPGLSAALGVQVVTLGDDRPAVSWLGVPLLYGDRILGVICIQSVVTVNLYTENERSLLIAIASQTTSAIQNARLFAEEFRRRQVADALREIARIVGSTLDLNEVVELLLDQLPNLIQFESVSIQSIQAGRRIQIGGRGLVTITSDEFPTSPSLPSPTSTSPGTSPLALRPSLWRTDRIEDDRLIFTVIQTKKPLVISDTHADSRWEIFPATAHIRSWLAAPMLVGNEVVGLLLLNNNQAGAYTQETAELASAFAAQAAVAIQNAQLFEQNQTALAETEALYEATAEINTASSYDEILTTLRGHTVAGRDANLSAIIFFNRPWPSTLDLSSRGDTLPSKQSTLMPETMDVLARWTTLPLETLVETYTLDQFPLLGKLLRPDTSLIIDDIPNDPRIDDKLRMMFLDDFQAQSAILVPLVVAGQWLGFINITYPEKSTFLEADVRRLMVLSGQAAVATQGLRSLELAEQRAREAQARSEELGLINRIVSAVVSSSDLRKALEGVTDELSRAFNLAHAGVALLSEDGQALTTVAEKTLTTGPSSIGVSVPVKGDRPSELVIVTRQRMVIPDVQTSPFYESARDSIARRGIECLALLPLIAGGEVIGTVTLATIEKGRIFTEQEMNLAGTLVGQIATAIQNTRLHEQTEQALAETAILYKASAELNSVQNYTEILDILRSSTILGHKSASNISINLFDRPWVGEDMPEWYLPIARWALVPTLEPPNARYPMGSWTTAKRMLNPEQLTVIEDASSDPRLDKTARQMYVEQMGARSLLFTPLVAGGQWIGNINAVFNQPVRFTDQDIRPLTPLAGQAAVAIQNLRLFAETRRRAAQLETASQIAHDTSGTLALDQLLNSAVYLIRDRYGYYHSSIFLIDDLGKNAVVRESTGEAGKEFKLRSHSLAIGSKSVIGYVCEQGTSLVLNDVAQSDSFRPNPLLPDTHAEVGIPLKIGTRVIGALDVQASQIDAFTPDDISILQTLADQIAVAVDNARSYELAQQAIAETRQRVQELSILNNVSQSLASAPMDINEIGQIVAQNFVNVLKIPQCSISLYEPDTDSLRTVVDFIKNEDNDELAPKGDAGETFNLADYPATSQVMESLQPLVVQTNDPNADTAELSYMWGHGIYTLVILPLAVKGQAFGIVELEAWDKQYQLTSDQINLAMTVANSSAVSLENARLYQEQRETAEKLREVDKLKSQFLANMSHELRTPLNSIIGFSRVILKGIDGPVSELQQQDLTAINSAGQHLLNLINDILDISKIEAGKMELAFDENVDLHDIINGAMSYAIGLTKDKPIRLDRYIAPNFPLVRADATRIRQVLINFLSNATKFTDRGSITVKADTQVGPTGRPEVIVSVTDTGIGIAPEDQDKLFTPFQQVDASPTRKTGGTGLGLSISRMLIELHGGRAGMVSQVGAGSTFYFTLPLPYVEPAPVLEGQGRVILAIDDDRQVISLYERYLKEHGYQIIPLTDPKLAVERARTLLPFAITLDIMMPERNGWQVLEDLKADPVTRSIPVVICSIVEDQAKGFSMGAADYLSKPILQDDLVGALHRLNADGNIRDVLVIDDDQDDLRLVKKILEENTQYQVRLANGGPEGLVAIQTMPPQAIIMDLFMPKLDGFTLLETLRADPALRDIPVIIFTAGDISEEQRQRLNDFSQKMIRKGLFKEEDLLTSIEHALHKFNPKR